MSHVTCESVMSHVNESCHKHTCDPTSNVMSGAGVGREPFVSVAVYCSVLQRVAVCCRMLQSVSECCNVLQCVAVRCSALQCVAVRCSALQCVAVIQMSSGTGVGKEPSEKGCNVLQHAATYCNTLQHAATHCNTLQQSQEASFLLLCWMIF